MMLSLSVLESFCGLYVFADLFAFLGHTANQFYQRPDSKQIISLLGESILCDINF